MELCERKPGALVLGPTRYGAWTISAPWQSQIAGPFEACVYLTALPTGPLSVRVRGKSPEAAHDAAVAAIEAAEYVHPFRPHDLPIAGSGARRIYDYLCAQKAGVHAEAVANALHIPVKRVRPALSNLRMRRLATSSGKMPYMTWRALIPCST